MALPNITLASGSRYRLSLASKLIPNIKSIAPDIDETPLVGETPEALVARLAYQKATAAAQQGTDGLFIGSDQVAIINGEPLSKPGNFDKAFEQLSYSSGKTVRFLTSLCLYNSVTKQHQASVETFDVCFNTLTDELITLYLKAETPYDCAGSFKCEGLGITLFKKLSGDDPNTLIGLPLIRLTEFLRNEGVEPLALHTS